MPNCISLAIVGAAVGFMTANVFAEPICLLFDISNHHGDRGPFTVLVVIPALTIFGGVVGGIIGARTQEP
jgi:hypothetical protein